MPTHYERSIWLAARGHLAHAKYYIDTIFNEFKEFKELREGLVAPIANLPNFPLLITNC